MTAERSFGLTELAKYGFADLGSTVAKLDQLVGLVGDSGHSALASLAKVADPDQALNALLDLADKNRAAVKKILVKSDSADRLCRVLGASSALVDFLRRSPQQLVLFEKPIHRIKTPEQLNAALLNAIQPTFSQPNVEESWNALRLQYRVELLQLAIFDLTQPSGEAAMQSVAAGLSDLAGAALEGALAIARHELTSSTVHGIFSMDEVAATRLTVIGMGKCGARELNYISDVDVIFVAEGVDGVLTSQRAVEVATRLAARLMRAIDGTAREPMLWQVDANLRPEGKSGALVRTLESHLAYYDRWAESWEFQALLKARPIAGDLQLGQDYVDALAPKVWSASTRANFVESVQKMRQRVTDYIPSSEVDRQLKLGPGGLRDIEFTIQLLQLVHGRTDESVRIRDTISGVEALASAGYIAREEAGILARHYRFLRLLEHRIQLSQMRRTHLMPTSETALRALARSVDTKSNTAELLERWEQVKSEVRSLHQKLFYRPLLSAVSKLSESDLTLSTDQAEDRLRAIGFVDSKGALAHISALTSGLSRRAAIQRQLLPVLLEWFAQGTDPDAALLAFRRLSEDLGDSHWYLRMLRDSSGAAERMTQVLSNSRLATNLFERVPEAAAWFEKSEDLIPITMDEFQAEVSATISRHQELETLAAALRALRRRETLRVAMGAVLGDLSIDQVAQGLSDITEGYLVGALSAILGPLGSELANVPISEVLDFGIVAMGRFGGQELGFGSDADVMFVYRVLEGADPELAQTLAERVIAELRRCTADQVLEFELDLDLRPEGKNGPIARSINSYAKYYERWANTWESQALLRARPIAGSESLVTEFTKLIDSYRYPAELKESAVIDIRRIKARVETERLPLGADPKRHLKLGPGSLSDVEWLVQLLQLRFAKDFPSIRSPKTLQALAECAEAGLIADHDARVLAEAWTLASRVRSAAVLWTGKKSDVLPTDRKQLEGLARILEYPRFSSSQLEQDYLAFTRRARIVFERVFYEWHNEDMSL